MVGRVSTRVPCPSVQRNAATSAHTSPVRVSHGATADFRDSAGRRSERHGFSHPPVHHVEREACNRCSLMTAGDESCFRGRG